MARTTRSTRAAKARPAAAASSTRSIDSFGRVSKRVAPSSSKKATAAQEAAAERLLAEQQTPQIKIELPALPLTPQKPTSSPASTSTSRKRRASEIVEDGSTSESSTTCTKRTRRPKASIAALLKKAADDASSSSDDSSSKHTRRLLSSLNLRSSPSASPSALPRSASSSPRPASTAPTTPCDSESEPDAPFSLVILPSDLLDLLRLQAAFTKTLALHHAHHGSNAPVDVRALCLSVAQAWGKRRVTLEDIQRCIGVAASKSEADSYILFLADYGRGKICIELRQNAENVGTLSNQLNESFETNLRSLWSEAVGRGGVDAKKFIQSLPKASVSKCTSMLQTSAVRAKGQRTLEELMHGIALKKKEQEAKEVMLKAPITAQASATGTTKTEEPKMSLLDRIRYRQLQRTQQQATGVAPPTPEELERRAALHRACDIAEVLSMLCTSSRQQNRVSFGMVAVLTKLKDSLRLPISREEGVSCVRLLAKEVAPQWIQIVSMGGREIVIMLTNSMPSKAELQSRVESLS